MLHAFMTHAYAFVVYGSFPLCGSELAEPIDLPGFRGSEAGFLTQWLWANHGFPLSFHM